MPLETVSSNLHVGAVTRVHTQHTYVHTLPKLSADLHTHDMSLMCPHSYTNTSYTHAGITNKVVK